MRKLIHKWVDNIIDNTSEILSVIGTVMIAFGFYKNINWWIIGVAIIIQISAIIIRKKSNKNLEELKKENETLKSYTDSLFSSFDKITNFLLFELSEELGLGNQERISAYLQSGKVFQMIGRYSKNPQLQEKGRGIYPLYQGCIGEAYKNGFSKFTLKYNPESNLEEYIEECEKNFAMEKTTIMGMKMKSQSYLGIAFWDFSKTRKIGILIIESLKQDNFDNFTMIEITKTKSWKSISDFICNNENLMPNPQISNKEEF